MSQISFRKKVTVAANSTNSNAVQGTNIEFLNGPWLVSLYASESAAGMELTLANGAAETYLDAGEPNIATAAGIVSNQTDQLLDSVLVQNAHMILKVQNTTAGSLDANILLVAQRVPTQ